MSPHIVVFDSGIGGTSVLQHIQNALPDARYSYVMDNKYLPYGKHSKSFLNQRIVELITNLDNHLDQIDVLVVACNTASTYTLDLLRKKLSIPVVGVVPAIKPAALQSINKRIGVLATPATISNEYTRQLVNDFASDCEVELHGSIELVVLAEKYFWQKSLCNKKLEHVIGECRFNETMDALVLGCTHFPIIAKYIKNSLPENCKLIDSGEAIARRVRNVVAELDQEWIDSGIKKPLQYYATAPIVQSKLDLIQIDF